MDATTSESSSFSLLLLDPLRSHLVLQSHELIESRARLVILVILLFFLRDLSSSVLRRSAWKAPAHILDLIDDLAAVLLQGVLINWHFFTIELIEHLLAIVFSDLLRKLLVYDWLLPLVGRFGGWLRLVSSDRVEPLAQGSLLLAKLLQLPLDLGSFGICLRRLPCASGLAFVGAAGWLACSVLEHFLGQGLCPRHRVETGARVLLGAHLVDLSLALTFLAKELLLLFLHPFHLLLDVLHLAYLVFEVLLGTILLLPGWLRLLL